MTDTIILNQKIRESGLKNSFIQEKLGISRSSWWMKRTGKAPIKTGEIQILCKLLGITSLREKEQIFFAEK